MFYSIVENIIPSAFEYWNYHKKADQHEKNLKRKRELLQSREDDIKTKLDSELRPGKIPKQEVKLWLRNVETVKGEIDIGPEPARWNFLSRMQNGEFAFKKTKEVVELCEASDFTDGLVLDLPERIGKMMPPSTLVGESTAQSTKKEILACLIDDKVGKIGVYGMGGIGKTTVMKEVNNFLLNESDKFQSVIWVTVSKEFDLLKLQNDIACKLNLKPPKFEDEITREAELYTALKGRRYVLILDDLSEAFALEKVGIPEPTSANGCKIVLTTQDLDVCRGMSCKDIKIELLSEEEARELFLHKMEYDVFNNPHLKAIAEEVLQTCARLPLAIVTIAGSFKRLVHDYEWRDALEQLRTSLKGFDNIETQVHKVLKFSYERLKEDKEKRKARIMRNRVEELENKVRSMDSTIAELNSKISYIMAENASLRPQSSGNVQPPLPKVKKSENRKSKGKTKKVASVSFLGLLFFVMLFGGLVPFVNVRYGGIGDKVPGGVGYVSDRFYDRQLWRVSGANEYSNGSGGSVGGGFSSGEFDNPNRVNYVRGRVLNEEYERKGQGLQPLPGSDESMASQAEPEKKDNKETGLAIRRDLAQALAIPSWREFSRFR